MKVLIGFEFSQTICQAFRNKGHEAYSCDLLPTDGNPEWHIQDNVFNIINENWNLAVFHPPCTFLCNSGVRWLHTEKGRWHKMEEATKLFKQLLDAPIPKIAIENPVMHKYSLELIGHKYDQIIHPWMFSDHTTSKATCLWLKNLPLLRPDKFLPKEQRTYEIHKASPGPNRWKIRSKTFLGVAEAMSNQWSSV